MKSEAIEIIYSVEVDDLTALMRPVTPICRRWRCATGASFRRLNKRPSARPLTRCAGS